MSQYLEIIKASTSYATKMSCLRNRIFNDIVRPVDSKSRLVVKKFKSKPFYKLDHVVNYYPRHMEAFHLMSKLREYGLYRDEHRDFQDEMKRIQKLRGKEKPKKGSGKQTVFKK